MPFGSLLCVLVFIMTNVGCLFWPWFAILWRFGEGLLLISACLRFGFAGCCGVGWYKCFGVVV